MHTGLYSVAQLPLILDCNVFAGAKVIQANKEASKLKALLDSDGDTYVKNDCKADKWFLVELSQVAKINQVEIWQVCRRAAEQRP